MSSFKQLCSISTFILLIALISTYYLFNLKRVQCVLQPNKFYTHIIVGAGTTGCVLAARLSENSDNTVLLIEAGHEFGLLSSVPLFNTLLQKSTYDWSYETVEQKWSSKGFKNAVQFWPRGKGLGGSSQMNFMIHGFLDVNDLLDWENRGAYNFSNIMHYYNNINDDTMNTKKCLYSNYLFYNTSYNINNKKSKYVQYIQKNRSKLSESFQKAINAINATGLKFKTGLSTIYKGCRWSSFHSHLLPALGRENLHILCDTEVTKILFLKKKAIGVHAESGKRRYVIYSQLDILLSAGAVNTPKLLLLSGIGNSSDLNRLKIPVISDLPGVGQNLHDHLNLPLYVSFQKSVSLTLSKISNISAIWKYLIYRKGVIGKSPITATAYMSQQINIILFGMGSTDKTIFLDISNFKDETFDAVFPLHKNKSQEGLVFLISCAQVKSRGYIKLNNSHPHSKPTIDPQYLSKKYDLECIKKGVELVKKIVESKSFRKLGAHIHWPNIKECTNLKKSNDNEFIDCLIKYTTITGYHPGGTCTIGDENNIYTVTNHEFRLKGLQNIRIIDASVLPTPISTFPNSFLIAMAEYATEFLT